MKFIQSLLLFCFFLLPTYSLFAQETESEKIYNVADVAGKPRFPGDESDLSKYLVSNIQYPEIDKENKIQGLVVLRFVIEKTGEISNIEVIRSVSATLDQEAIRVVSNMPKWIPGYDKNREYIKVKYTLPIKFRLESKQ
jgi:periplasmic protein TonB